MKKLTPAELNAFCEQVALMLGSGLALYDGLESMAESAKDTPAAELYRELSDRMSEVGSLYKILKDDGRWPRYLVEMVGIGERAGCLEEVMKKLAEYYEREDAFKAAIKTAIIYPIVLGVMMLVVLVVVIVRVLPVFSRLFRHMGTGETDYAQLTMRWGQIAGWSAVGLVGVATIFALTCAILMCTSARDSTVKMLKKTFKPIRNVGARLSITRATSVLSMLLSSGFPMEEALDLLPRVMEDEGAIDTMVRLRDRVKKGMPLTDALIASDLFDPMRCTLLRISTKMGNLSETIDRIAYTYQREADESIERLIAVVEPVTVAALCTILGIILLSLMAPMANLIAGIY